MTVTVNDKTYEFQESISLQKMLEELSMKTQSGIALAVNESVVPKSQWPETKLTSGDKIIIIKATQGG